MAFWDNIIIHRNFTFENLSDSLKLLMKNGYDAPANYAHSSTLYVDNNKSSWDRQIKERLIDYKKVAK